MKVVKGKGVSDFRPYQFTVEVETLEDQETLVDIINMLRWNLSIPNLVRSLDSTQEQRDTLSSNMDKVREVLEKAIED